MQPLKIAIFLTITKLTLSQKQYLYISIATQVPWTIRTSPWFYIEKF